MIVIAGIATPGELTTLLILVVLVVLVFLIVVLVLVLVFVLVPFPSRFILIYFGCN